MFSNALKKTPVILVRHIGTKIRDVLGFKQNDLPLNKGEDARFLMLLIALMSFLAVLTTSGFFALSDMTERWSTGLENKVTIEIPIETKTGALLSPQTITRETQKVESALKDNKNIRSISILSAEEIQDLLSPWLGHDVVVADLPIPGIISVELSDSSEQILGELKAELYKVSQFANLETHHEWLVDLLKFTSTLRVIALLVTILIIGISITSIMAGMRARLAIHHKDVTLLHHMGASDLYIAKQFQRHAMVLTFIGSVAGTILGVMTVLFIYFFSTQVSSPLIPALKISTIAFLLLCAIPILASFIAILTSRFTVLRNLSQMP